MNLRVWNVDTRREIAILRGRAGLSLECVCFRREGGWFHVLEMEQFVHGMSRWHKFLKNSIWSTKIAKKVLQCLLPIAGTASL